MSRNDSKYFSTMKKGEIPELKEELNSQYKVPFPQIPIHFLFFSLFPFLDPSDFTFGSGLCVCNSRMRTSFNY
ncbi:hypothetical protein MTR_3g118335 [Medicago truncatula]|uniref:Uncharacterized protein n=1 Tax=Medicago truncatula TaxID=3880 RepID=A0A072V427_MEDTR|nr:hypothetical protein MTR_3g118335 [Medicago truncatula]